jgi:hypothetical protein
VFAGGVASSAEPALRLTISVREPVVKVGAEIKVKIALRNVADHAVNVVWALRGIDPVGDAHLYRATVTDNTGGPVPYTALGKKIWGEGAGFDASWITQPLEPGDAVDHSLVLSKLYDLSKPVKYTI